MTSGEGVPTSALLLTKDTPMIEGTDPSRRRRRRSGAVLGRMRGRRAPGASVRLVRSAAHAAAPDVPVVQSFDVAVGRRCPDAGRVWSVVVPHPPLLPAYGDQAPYNVVVVTLDDDPTIRFVGNVVAGPGAPLNSVEPAHRRDRRRGRGGVQSGG